MKFHRNRAESPRQQHSKALDYLADASFPSQSDNKSSRHDLLSVDYGTVNFSQSPLPPRRQFINDVIKKFVPASFPTHKKDFSLATLCGRTANVSRERRRSRNIPIISASKKQMRAKPRHSRTSFIDFQSILSRNCCVQLRRTSTAGYIIISFSIIYRSITIEEFNYFSICEARRFGWDKW